MWGVDLLKGIARLFNGRMNWEVYKESMEEMINASEIENSNEHGGCIISDWQ